MTRWSPLLISLVLVACGEPDKVPADALLYTVQVTATGPDECHPGNTEGWQETYEYAVYFDAAEATLYVDREPFGSGTVTGCNLSYQTVVLGTQGRSGGELKWQITGSAQLDRGDNSCVMGDADAGGNLDFNGTETIEIIGSEDDAIEVGCTYPMSTTGTYSGIEEE